MANENKKYEQVFQKEVESGRDGSLVYPRVYMNGASPTSFVGELGQIYRITVEKLIPNYLDEQWKVSAWGDIRAVGTDEIIASELKKHVAERIVKDHNLALGINKVRGEYYSGS